MPCVDELPYEVVLSKASFAECRAYVEKHCPQYCNVDPGFKLFEKAIIGVPPIAIGLDGTAVFFPFTKPCYGTFLLRIENADEAARLRPRLKGR